MFHCALCLFSLACSLASAQPAKDLKSVFQGQWKQSQFIEAERTLEDGFKTSPDDALALARSLIETGNDFARPLGAAYFAKHATTMELAALVAKLPRGGFPDERRLLVRALGDRAKGKDTTQPVIDAASTFVDDADLCVAAAAILSLADTRDPDAIGFFIHRLADIPANAGNPIGGDRGILARAAAGALDSLTDERFRSASDAKAWWKKRAGKKDGAAPRAPADKAPSDKKDTPAETGTYGGQTYYVTDRFNIFYRIGRDSDAPADGDLSLMTLAPILDKSAEAADKSLMPVVGRAHVPVLRLYLCDAQQFNAKAGMASFAGVTQGNEIVLKAVVPRSMPVTLWHEYIHAIHDSTFDNQPRWLSEGLAMSYTLSAKGAMKRDASDPEIREIITRGGFSEMLNWNSGGSGDAKETARYATAHLCIDYLRFAVDRGVPDTRLAFVMGRLSRRQGARQAIESVYGITVKELDQGLRDLAGP